MKILSVFLLAPIVWAQSTFPPELTQHLKLTAAQKTAVETLETSFEAAVTSVLTRVGVLQSEIRTETAKPVVDSHALGVRYAERETLRRGLSAKFAQLRFDSLAALNDAQRAQLPPLIDAGKMYPLVSDAYTAGLFPSSQRSPATALGIVYLNVASYYGPGYYGSGSLVSLGLQDFLGLNDSQVAQMTGLVNFSNLDQQGYSNQRSLLQLQILAEIAKETLEDDAVGLLYAAVEDLNRKQAATAAELISQLQGVLTSPQKAKLKALSDADNVKVVVAEAGCVNLLDMPSQLAYSAASSGLGTPGVIVTASRSGAFGFDLGGIGITGLSFLVPNYGCGFFK